MTPRLIVERAADEGLDIIALTDHNSARNTEVAMELGARAGILVLPGLEICSLEEAHVLAIFKSLADAIRMQEYIYRDLKPLGDGRWQVVVDHEDVVLEFDGHALMGATNLPLTDLPDKVHEFGGLAIASHIDRGAFSISSQFGFIPENVIFDAYEVIRPEKADALFSKKDSTPWIASSDAHNPEDIGCKKTVFLMHEASFDEIALCLKGEGGRVVRTVYADA